MSSSNNCDFRKIAAEVAEADNEREREKKTRTEAHLLKLEIDQQNTEDESQESSANYTANAATNSVISDSSFSSKFNSRNSSVEPLSPDMRIKQLEEQNKEYKLSYIQLVDQKEALIYQNGLISDQMDDLREELRKIIKELADKRKACSYQKCQIEELTNRCKFLKSEVCIRDQLIVDNNLIMLDEKDFSGENNNKSSDGNPVDNARNSEENFESKINGTALLPKDLVEQLKELSENSLENCIRKLFDDHQKHQDNIKNLQRKLTEEKDEYSNRKGDSKKRNDGDYDSLKQNFQTTKSQCQEYKRQLQISQQKVTALEADVIRLEGQVKRHKSIAESCEKQEEELKQAKRKYQREFREAQNKIEDLKSENATLQKKLDKYAKQKSKKETN